MARKKAVKKYTLSEFKAWLEGVEEIQPASWSPDGDQWKMIREKIASIVEPPPAPPKRPPPPAQPPQRVAQPQMAPAMPRPGQLPVSALTGDTTPTGAAGEGVAMSPAAKAALAGKLPSEIATDPAHGSKTPNIDTMDGNYESNFT